MTYRPSKSPAREDIAVRNISAPSIGKIRAKTLALGAGLLACAIGFTGCPQKSAEEPPPATTSSAKPPAPPVATPAAAPKPVAPSTTTPAAQTTAKTTTPKKVGNAEPIRIADLDLVMLPIPAGSFMMGSNSDKAFDNEKPAHKVTITKPFWLGKYQVTQEQYEKLMGTNPSKLPAPLHGKLSKEQVAKRDRYKKLLETNPSLSMDAKHPVERVSWDDAMAFCKKLNERERAAGRLPAGYEYTLPSEAQWEYACRAGTTGDYSFAGGADILWKYGNYCDKSNTNALSWQDNAHNDMYDQTAPVGSYLPNAWGLYDMHGNVQEWCSDWFDTNYYESSPTEDPMGPATPPRRKAHVTRGGGWNASAPNCRSSFRMISDYDVRLGQIGFRLALTSVSTEADSTASKQGKQEAGAAQPSTPAITPALAQSLAKSAATNKTRENGTFRIPNIDLEMQPIPAGSFLMGSSTNEPGRLVDEPQHRVTLTKPFWLGKFPVTQEQYEKMMGSNPSGATFKGAKRPVVMVSWDDAIAFCKELNAYERACGRLPEGYEYTLPTEAQWEYACRAGTTTPFYTGNDLTPEQANYTKRATGREYSKSMHRTTAVGAYGYPANAWGLFEMHGNVSEWCLDWYSHGYYTRSPAVDPKGPDAGDGHLARDSRPGRALGERARRNSKSSTTSPTNTRGIPFEREGASLVDVLADTAPPRDQATPSTQAVRVGDYRVARGGSWLGDAPSCRSASRGKSQPDRPNGTVGFRLALSPVR